MVDYDPFGQEVIHGDPHPILRALRDESPHHYQERWDAWALSRFEDSQVSVNCISPGATRTRLVDPWIAVMKQDLNMTDEQIMATYGIQQPENMAPLAVYLCTDEGRKITGRTFEVAGDAIHLVPPPARHPSAINPHEGLWTTEDMRKVIPRLVAGQP